MSTPLFLSEAVRLELRNILKSFEVGMRVKTPDNEEGYIDFICDQYVTVVTHEWEDKDKLNGKRQVKVLVYAHEWENLYVEDTHFFNKKNYTGYISEHPGNEDLPKDITGKDPENK